MPSVLVEFLNRLTMIVASLTSFDGGSCSHRQKQLEKWNRREILDRYLVLQFDLIQFLFRGLASVVIVKLKADGVKLQVTNLDYVEHLVGHVLIGTEFYDRWFGSFFCVVSGSLMDMPIRCSNLVSEGNCLRDLKPSYINHKQCTSTIRDSSLVELGNALNEVLHNQDIREPGSSCIPSLDRHELCHQEKDKKCGELKMLQDNSSVATSQKSLCKCATFPSSGKKFPPSMNEKNKVPGTTLHGQFATESVSPACTRSISLPTPLKLVSAIKGSREKQGMPLKKLTVKWAPDVYDPPVTTVSHTVKSHNQQRSRTNKKNGKHKQKGKSSRGSSSYKKQYRKSVGSSDMHSKLPATSDRSHLGGYSQSEVELVDFAVTNQDSNCGSSFLRTSLAKVHISVAEAT
ncbi:hypothetical protein HHK36_019027 [Tetracentron sinense]|uniref:Uncharacterized protein n=1 Tax=Tetracentron sinense TaxID=13715 RepID=A0A835DBU5_TETSI|nr:hypothetical protein HHK36_019027 [Tetracentron sinense]